MNQFTISQLEQFSGIKAHTIRIWEKRYNALNPSRSLGNTRYYDGLQLKRLLNIVSLVASGAQISKVCALSDNELSEKIYEQLNQTTSIDKDAENFILQFIAAGMSYDTVAFNSIYCQAQKLYEFELVYKLILLPLLRRLGILWVSDRIPPSQEHFISNLIEQKIQAAIHALPPIKRNEETWLLALPEYEFHEIGLLFAHYLLTKAGKTSIYLGSNMPISSLQKSVQELIPHALYIFLIHYDLPEKAQQYLNSLAFAFKDCKIYVSGNEHLLSQLFINKDVEWIKDIDHLISKL